jgi:hypothetical protein
MKFVNYFGAILSSITLILTISVFLSCPIIAQQSSQGSQVESIMSQVSPKFYGNQKGAESQINILYQRASQFILEKKQRETLWNNAILSNIVRECYDREGNISTCIIDFTLSEKKGYLVIGQQYENEIRFNIGFTIGERLDEIYKKIKLTEQNIEQDISSGQSRLLEIDSQGICFVLPSYLKAKLNFEVVRLSDLRPIKVEDFSHRLFDANQKEKLGLQKSTSTGLYAVIVGCGDFRNLPGASNIEACVSDAQNMYDVLTQVYGFPASNIRLRKDSENSTSDDLSSTQVLNDLDWLAQNASTDDMVIFYFSGHGSGSSTESCRIYTQNGSISDATLNAKLNNIHAKNKIAILDACHSGGFLSVCNGDGNWIVAAAQADETSKTGYYATNPVGINGSVFTGWLMDALTYYQSIGRTIVSHILFPPPFFPLYPDADGNNQVSLREAFNYAKAGTESLWNSFLGRSSHPQMSPTTGDLSIGKYYEPQLTVDGSAASGNLSVSNQEDWYRFTTGTSGSYTIETHGAVDTYMYLYQSDKTTLITYNDDGGVSNCSKIVQSLSSSTTYSVKVKGYNGGAVGAYTIDVKSAAATFNPPRSLAATGGNAQVSLSWSAPSSKPLLGDETPEKRAEIERLGLSNDPMYKVVSSKAEGAESTLGLSNYKIYRSTSQNGTYTSIGTSTTTSYTNTGLTNGATYWYYVTAVYTSPSGESAGSNTVSATPSSGTTERLLTVDGSAASGNLSVSNQEDWYRFTTGTSGSYTIETHGAVDTYMYLYQSDKTTLITYNDDGGVSNCSKIVQSLSSSTTYSVKVKGYNGGAVGAYTIDVKSAARSTAATFNSKYVLQNYPNPFNPTTKIIFNIPKQTQVKLSIYDILGREVDVLVDKDMNPGIHEITFDGSKLTSGVYFYSLTTENITEIKKLILIK